MQVLEVNSILDFWNLEAYHLEIIALDLILSLF